MAYAGEAPTKKIARASAYAAIRRLLPPSRLGDASVVTLAGPGAHDIGPIQAFDLCRNPGRVMMVDVDKRGLDRAEERWPGVLTHHGPLHTARVPWPIDVAMLDFCGHVETPSVQTGLQVLAGRLRMGSVIAVTFQKGREAKDSNWAKLVKEFTRIGGFTSDRTLRSGVRATLLLWRISHLLGVESCVGFDRRARRPAGNTPTLTCRALFDYVAHRVPMEILVMRIEPFARLSRTDLDYGETIAKATPASLLEFADDLKRNGVDAGKALDVSPGTLAAWKAHRTMGTYAQ